MKVVDSPRRQIVMGVLLALAAIGAGIRHWADNPSLARDIGTLMLVLWLPAVGNLVAFGVRKAAPLLRPRRGFPKEAPFRSQLRAELRPPASAPDGQAAWGRDCTVVVGQEGFSARTAEPLSRALGAGAQGPCVVELELLRPALALPRLPAGTDFHLLVGQSLVASGRVMTEPAR